MVTISDVARRAHVSTATVSRILNGQAGQASAETEQRVIAAIKELRYVPNSMGRNLRRQESRAWTLLLPTIENPFVTQLSRGIEDTAQASGFGVLMCNTYDDPSKERNYLREAEMGRSSGVIVTPTSPDVDITTLLDLRVPVVSILRPLGAETSSGQHRVDTVLNDTAGTSRRATANLIERGYKRIACLPGLEGDYTDELRLDGYRQAHADAGLALIDGLVRHSSVLVDVTSETVGALLDEGSPDAIVIANSLMALGVINGLIAHGIDPRSGPALFSCDSANWTDILTPYMSVAHQPAYEFGQTAANLLLQRLAEPTRAPQTVVLEATLEIRGA